MFEKICTAIERKNNKRLEFLLSANNPQQWNIRGAHGGTLLMKAIVENNKEACLCLIKHKVSIDDQDNLGWTALMVAAEANNEEICNILLNSGASKDIQNEDGDTAWSIAYFNGNKALATRLETRIKTVAPAKKRINSI